jgi:hypothetical protein
VKILSGPIVYRYREPPILVPVYFDFDSDSDPDGADFKGAIVAHGRLKTCPTLMHKIPVPWPFHNQISSALSLASVLKKNPGNPILPTIIPSFHHSNTPPFAGLECSYNDIQ